ncbi:MAG: hypothetical protein JW947_08910 [Sedimentisphaerales bacterium]|nr:hypothetical protein [Sedimentisphaerales bacterium]
MDWTVKYLKEDGIMHAKITGVVTWGECRKTVEEIFSYGRKKDVHRYLLECPQFEHKLTLLQIDDMPKLLKELGFGAEDKMAIVVDSSSRHIKELKFLENVARLASIQVRHFTDYEKGAEWLRAEQPQEKKKEEDEGKSKLVNWRVPDPK